MRKKRLRGFRRHLRAHQQRAAVAASLDLGLLTHQQYDHVKLGLAPWHVHEKPPLAIRQLWLGRLLANFSQWQRQLRQQYPEFYLAVWVFEPAFGESQLVAAVEGRKAWYETVFGEELSVPLPHEYQAVAGVGTLQWVARQHVAVFAPEEFAAMGAAASRKPHWPLQLEAGASAVAVALGLVWVGQAKSG